MSTALLARQARNLLSVVEIKANRALGREIVPFESDVLAIEPTSTCNLKCRFCAYETKSSPKVAMKHGRFVDYMEQAVAMGYRRFHLTPSTGDVFMDRHIFEKLDYLEAHPGVSEYFFFTNLTVLDAQGVLRLASLKKLKHLYVSVYGHDQESFIKVTKSTAKVYRRLLTNLETLRNTALVRTRIVEVFIRSTRHMPRTPSTDLLKLLELFKKNGVRVKHSKLYHSFGGHISRQDMHQLGIDVMDASKIYKNGACAYLFNSVQVLATGAVHACSCADANITLQIGNLNETPLHKIISTENPLYMKLIDDQQCGRFMPVCRDCGAYKSIYHARLIHRKDGTPRLSIAEFKTALDAKGSLGRQANVPAVNQQ